MVTATPIAHTAGTWRLIYFDAPTRGEQIRLLFAVSSTPFKDVRLDYPGGLEPYKKAAMGDASPLCGTDLCPAVTAPDGTHVVETSEIMRFVGERIGLAPAAGSSAGETAMAMCLLAQSVLNGVFYALLKPMVVSHIFRTECLGLLSPLARLLIGTEKDYLIHPAAKLGAALNQLEQVLSASGGPFVLGDDLCYADVSLFAVINEVLEFRCFDRPALLAAHPRCATLLDTIGSKAKAWLALRVQEHQYGLSTVGAVAAVNTPFPWSKKVMPNREQSLTSVEWAPVPKVIRG